MEPSVGVLGSNDDDDSSSTSVRCFVWSSSYNFCVARLKSYYIAIIEFFSVWINDTMAIAIHQAIFIANIVWLCL